MKYLPFFVYGTLIKGMGNDGLIPDEAKRIKGYTRGKMFNVGLFPAVVNGKDKIHGEIVYVPSYLYKRTMKVLDTLEGYRGKDDDMYKRVIKKVWDNGGNEIDCWMYLWNRDIKGMEYISHGSWVKYWKGQEKRYNKYLREKG